VLGAVSTSVLPPCGRDRSPTPDDPGCLVLWVLVLVLVLRSPEAGRCDNMSSLTLPSLLAISPGLPTPRRSERRRLLSDCWDAGRADDGSSDMLPPVNRPRCFRCCCCDPGLPAWDSSPASRAARGPTPPLLPLTPLA
jgi:hypothetical protein